LLVSKNQAISFFVAADFCHCFSPSGENLNKEMLMLMAKVTIYPIPIRIVGKVCSSSLICVESRFIRRYSESNRQKAFYTGLSQ